MAPVSRNPSIPYRPDSRPTPENLNPPQGPVDRRARRWGRRARPVSARLRGMRTGGRFPGQDEVLSCRDSVIIQTDTSKILFVFIQYQEGIEWNYGICAISSRLARSSISDGRRLASPPLSRHYRGRSRIWRVRLAFPCSTDYRAAFD